MNQTTTREMELLDEIEQIRSRVRDGRHQWVETVDAIGDPLMVHDAEGRIVRANKAYAALAGIGFPEIIGRKYWECFPRRGGPLSACLRDGGCADSGEHREEFAVYGGEIYTSKSFRLAASGGSGAQALHLFANVTRERRSQSALQERAGRALAQSEALVAVTSSGALFAGDLPVLAREITEGVSGACSVARVNVWLFNEEETELVCVDHFDAEARTHASGMVLKQDQFANEFRALKAAPYVAADEPLTDPRTAGYVESYLKPNHITSMLDAVVEVSGRHVGLLCLEHVDQAHHWENDEIAFARQMAEKIAIAASNRRARQAEAAMRASELRFRTLFDQAPTGISEIDANGRYLSVNQRLCEITGYSAAELLARTFVDLTHPDDRERDRGKLERMLSGELAAYATEKRYVRKDGTVVWAALSVTPIAHPERGETRFISIIEDITQRRVAESESRSLARFPEENPNAVMRLTSEGRVLYANSASRALLCFCQAEVGAIATGPCAALVRDCLASGSQRTVELPVGDRCYLLTVAPIAAEGYANVYGTDVTERRRAEEARDRSERYHRKLIEGSSDAFFVVDKAGKLAFRSESARRLTGFSSDEVIGKDFTTWVLPESRPAARRALLRAIQGPPETMVHAEMRVSRKDGVVLDIEAVGRNLLQDPDVNGIVVTARDVSERKRAEEHLRGALISTVEAMAATVEARDPYTAGHQHRVAELAAAIATEMGLPADRADGIRFGAMIHDLGKLQVPAELLSKPTRLTSLEYELIKTHAQAGYDIVKRIKFPWPVADMVHQHHERLDGSGYPQGLKGDAIALEARILAVADVVEAMSSHRPYRAGLGIDAALNEVESKKGVWFEPAAVDACLRLFRKKGFSLEKTFP